MNCYTGSLRQLSFTAEEEELLSGWITKLPFRAATNECFHYQIFCSLVIIDYWLTVALAELSFFFLFFPVKGFFMEFLLTWVKALRTVAVRWWTDCKAPRNKLSFVILNCINKVDLTRLRVNPELSHSWQSMNDVIADVKNESLVLPTQMSPSLLGGSPTSFSTAVITALSSSSGVVSCNSWTDV